MRLNKFTLGLKKVKGVLEDAAKISSREIKRSIAGTRQKIGKIQVLQKRKELFAELGRTLYEAHEDGLPSEVARFFNETELHEIISEIKEIDRHLLLLSQLDKKDKNDRT